jgi:hypothetical protein
MQCRWSVYLWLSISEGGYWRAVQPWYGNAETRRKFGLAAQKSREFKETEEGLATCVTLPLSLSLCVCVCVCVCVSFRTGWISWLLPRLWGLFLCALSVAWWARTGGRHIS